jgi:lysophospholipase L1-like esterase
MVKPYKTLLLLLFFIILSLIPTLFFPKDGLRIGSIKLQYPSVKQLLGIDTAQNKLNLKPEIVLLDRIVDSTINTIQNNRSFDIPFYFDSVSYKDSVKVIDTIPAQEFSADLLKSKINRMEFPDSTHQSLLSFFEALRNKSYNKKQIRILHYGDSQIEGDRITSYLRSRLQAKFGGGGIGFVHALPQSTQTAAVLQSTSSNWEKTTLVDHDKSISGINRYGVLGGYSSFTPSRNLFSKTTNEAWILFKRIGGINSSGRKFDRIRIFYGYNSKPFMVELDSDGKTNDAELIPNTNKLAEISWDIDKNTNTFEIKFKGDSSPLVFGISLETDKGIAVDNIPIRGSSGTDFTKTDMVFMKEMLQMLNAKLIILQFGVNVVPNIVESYKYYQTQLYTQIRAIQDALPNASIIMVGVSDVSKKEGLHYTSYPNIGKIRDAQRQAAFKAGIPFWDCYKAMGGKNSMAAWEHADPPLASKDFIHFTYRGANLIAEMFYAALISEYENYSIRKNKPLRTEVKVKKDSTNSSKSIN